MDMSLSKLWEMVKNRQTWCAVVHGVTKSWTQLSDWTTKPLIVNKLIAGFSFLLSRTVIKAGAPEIYPCPQMKTNCSYLSLKRKLQRKKIRTSYNHLGQRSPTFLAPGTGFTEDNFSTERGWGEWFRFWLPVTSCCVAQFLTGHGQVPVHGLGVGNPWSRSTMVEDLTSGRPWASL